MRYANICENERVVAEFYVEGHPEKPSVVANFSKAEAPRAVIVTYGNIVVEAIKARDVLLSRDIAVGIVLLEHLKPYDRLADELSEIIPESTEAIILLEEGIMNGGGAMLVKDKLEKIKKYDAINMSIMAIDDSFVHLGKGDTAYTAAGISAEDIVNTVINNLK